MAEDDAQGALTARSPQETHDPIIRFSNVTKEFTNRDSKEPFRALDGIDLSIDEGDIYGIIGYSGAGKSTLVRMINALERPTSGSVTVLGTEVTGLPESKLRPLRQKIGMVFQQFNLFSTRTVAQNIAYPLQLDHWRKDYQDRRVSKLLEFVGLSEHADKYPAQLSGGQKQRVGIARALATSPRILLADEATSALDPETTSEVLQLLRRANAELGVTIVLITHQMNVVRQIANRVAVMSNGRIVESGDVYDVFAAPQQPITRRFIGTAISGLPDAAHIDSLRARWPGRIITVLVRQREVPAGDGRPAVGASGQNISELIARHHLASGLIYGGMDTVDGAAIGALTYEFDDMQDRFGQFLDELTRTNDIIDFGTAADPRTPQAWKE
ncbi:MAG: methionine ABC transporter ATP-binding protein [Bifidobacteriaceae bacterium]|nr:methionine ABC transporter ATP-binding protein [Bifidobacteriaceae bacterium]